MPIKHVLIVDDSKSARLVLRKMLQNINLDVDMAASGEEALDYLKDKYPDAIFMDHAMPGLDGLQVVKKIKDNPDTEMIPIAMYTSREEDSYKEQTKTYGVVDILPKPAAPDTLSKVLNKLNMAYEEAQIKLTERKASAGAAPAYQPELGASIEAIEDIAQSSAESAIENAIDSQIIPLIENRLFQLKENILADIETTVSEIANPLYERRIREFSVKLERQVDAQINSLKTNLDIQFKMDREEVKEIQKNMKTMMTQQSKDSIQKNAEQIAHNVASEVYNARIKEFSGKLIQYLNSQIENLQTNIEQARENPDELFEELQNKLKPVLNQQASKSAWLAAEQVAGEITDKITQETGASMDSIKKRMYLLTGVAMLTGIFAAAIVYYLGL